MTQHPIDLLPEFVRIKCQAGVRAGRYVTAVIAAVVIVVIATTHMRFELDRSRERLARAEDQANIVIELEQRADKLTGSLDEAADSIELHEALHFPFEVSRLVSTMINQLPGSVTVEHLEIDANPRRLGRAQSQAGEGDTAVRVSVGEVSGFAASDDHIAELVARMESSQVYRSVTWDFTRSRLVREQPAREFRVSFQINLDKRYRVITTGNEGIERSMFVPDSLKSGEATVIAERTSEFDRVQ